MLAFSAFISLPEVLGWLSSFGGVRFSEVGMTLRLGAYSVTSAVDTSHETDTSYVLSMHETSNPYSYNTTQNIVGLCTVPIALSVFFFLSSNAFDNVPLQYFPCTQAGIPRKRGKVDPPMECTELHAHTRRKRGHSGKNNWESLSENHTFFPFFPDFPLKCLHGHGPGSTR